MKNRLACFGGAPVCKKLNDFNTYDQNEVNAAAKVVKSGVLSGFMAKRGFDEGGYFVKEFENKISRYFKVKNVITTNSWTTGIHCMLGAIGLNPGDEVLVPTWTMCASATMILNWLAIPVFVDINPYTLNICIHDLKRKINKRTKAILVVDIHGYPSDYSKIKLIAKNFKLKIIIDAAQSPGAMVGKKLAGTLGDIGGYSLNYHKHFHTGEGGIIVTNSDKLAKRCRYIRNHGEAYITKREDLSNIIGNNFRMGEIEAAIGIEQLKKLPSIIKGRIYVAKKIIQILEKYDFLKILNKKFDGSNVFYMIPILFDRKIARISREKFVYALQEEGLKSVIFNGYTNLHKLPIFKNKKAFGNTNIPWSINETKMKIKYKELSYPIAEKYHRYSFIGFQNCMFKGCEQDLSKIDKIFHKVCTQLTELKNLKI